MSVIVALSRRTISCMLAFRSVQSDETCADDEQVVMCPAAGR
jgi:hypothetical protein